MAKGAGEKRVCEHNQLGTEPEDSVKGCVRYCMSILLAEEGITP